MRNLLTYFKNIFDTKEISDENLRKFTEIHIQRLTNNNTGGIYDALILALVTAYTSYFGSITDEDTKTALKEGATVAMNIDMKAFKDAASQKEGIVRGIYGVKSPVYQEFYPHGITEYTNSTLENVETLMTRIVNAATNHQADIGDDFVNLFTLLKNNFGSTRTAQLALMAEVEGKKDSTIANRNKVESQLMKNLLVIASNNIGNTDAMNTYFDQSFIRPKKHKSFSGEIEAKTLKNIDERHYGADDSIVLQNKGTADLKFGLSEKADSLGTIFIRLSAGEKKTVLASELGDVLAAHFLNVQNDSDTISGAYKVTVEL